MKMILQKTEKKKRLIDLLFMNIKKEKKMKSEFTICTDCSN